MKLTLLQILKLSNYSSSLKGIFLLSALILFPIQSSYAFDLSELSKILPRVSHKISLVANMEINKVVLLRDKYPTACIYPTKTIIITSGLLRLVETEGELAFILAHEIAHVKKEPQKGEMVLRLLSGLSGGEGGLEREIVADMAAIDYLKKAHYNPISVISVLSRMPKSHQFDQRIQASRKYLSLSQTGKALERK